MAYELERDWAFAAADAIAARGEPVTVARLRDEIGAAELYPLIPLLQEWRIKRAIAESDPGEFWAAIVSSLGALMADAQEVAEQTATDSDRRARRMIERAEQDAALGVDDLHAQLAERAAESKLLREMLQEAQTEGERLHAELDSQNDAVASLPALDAERGAALAALRELQVSLREAEDRAAVAEADRREAERQREQTIEDLSVTLQNRVGAESQLEALKDLLRRSEGELAMARIQTDKLAAETEALRKRTPPGDEWLLDQSFDELPRQLAMAQSRISELKAEREGLKDRLADTKAQLAQANRLLELRLTGPQMTMVPQAAAAPEHPRMSVPAEIDPDTLPRGGKVEIIRRRR